MRWTKTLADYLPRILSLLAFGISVGVYKQATIWPAISVYWLLVSLKWVIDIVNKRK